MNVYRRIRESLNLTVSDVSLFFNVAPAIVERWENDREFPPVSTDFVYRAIDLTRSKVTYADMAAIVRGGGRDDYQRLKAFRKIGEIVFPPPTIPAALQQAVQAITALEAPPSPAFTPMLLWCPACHERHIDEGVFATNPHYTHSCQHCGLCWRPAIEPTTGVRFLPGFKNEVDETASQGGDK